MVSRHSLFCQLNMQRTGYNEQRGQTYVFAAQIHRNLALEVSLLVKFRILRPMILIRGILRWLL